jgi:hypothetical protein
LQSSANDKFHCKYDQKKLQQFWEQSVETVRKTGVPISTEGEWESQYDGVTINAGPGRGEEERQHPSSVIHDLAHWAVCTSAKRRAMPDFGLGGGPDSFVEAPEPMLGKATQAEEERASLLGIIMEWELGMPAADTMRLHSWLYPYARRYADGHRPMEGPDGEWYTECPSAITKAINWLVKQNLVSAEGKVNWAKVSQGCVR